MSEAVLADAQFSVAGVVKPFLGFEELYQGQPVSIPIAIPGTLDQDAGKTGFDPNLLSAIPVPFGSKVCLWLPTIFNATMGNLTVQPYRYTFVWRVRNLADFIRNRVAYQFPRQSPGEGGQQVVPAAVNSIVYEQMPVTFPTNRTAPLPSAFSAETRGIQRVVVESIRFDSAVANAAISPNSTLGNILPGAYQQGLAAGQEGGNNSVSFNQLQMDALGNEFLILVDREFDADDPSNTWNFQFGQRDNGFSRFFGTNDGSRNVIRDMGIYVFTGSNP